jgi:hypothetical protein
VCQRNAGGVASSTCSSRENSRRRAASAPAPSRLLNLGETGPLSQGVQAGRKALRTRHTNGMKVRKKMPRGVKKRPRGFK